MRFALVISLLVGTVSICAAQDAGTLGVFGNSHNVCIGLRACERCAVCTNVVAVGSDAARSLVRGKNVIVIGKGADVPSPVMDDYINIGGVLIIRNGVIEKAPEAGIDLGKVIRSEVKDALDSALH